MRCDRPFEIGPENPMTDVDLAAIAAERARLQAEYVTADRPPSSARGIHHAALICSDVEQTIKFYQGLLEFPLTEIFGNRDYEGSSHFFFDVGNGNLLAFFDFPGLDVGPYAEVLGGINHIAISVTREKWEYLRAKLDAAGVPYPTPAPPRVYGPLSRLLPAQWAIQPAVTFSAGTGVASWRLIPARPRISQPTNAIASDAITPRLANAHVPVLPPSPSGPSRYPCQDSHEA
jgi:catechol 2,3-dioxygenase-like lactoylglutathione lyase family enzyme